MKAFKAIRKGIYFICLRVFIFFLIIRKHKFYYSKVVYYYPKTENFSELYIQVSVLFLFLHNKNTPI